jgi:hypothetical protein
MRNFAAASNQETVLHTQLGQTTLIQMIAASITADAALTK